MAITFQDASERRDAGAMADIAAIVILAGAIRESPLVQVSGRSILELPLADGVSVLDNWIRALDVLRTTDGSDASRRVPTIVASNPIARMPSPNPGRTAGGLEIRADSETPRGSGGVLRDIAAAMDPDSRLLVLPGHAAPMSPVAGTLARMRDIEADVVIHADRNNRPTGAYLIRCDALREVPGHGYVDLKEQAIPAMARDHDVRVATDPADATLAIRTLEGYLAAVRTLNDPGSRPHARIREDWACTFAITEPGASVSESAVLHDSVVLAGARVEAGAVVVRSLLGPGGVAGAGAVVFDEALPSDRTAGGSRR